MLMAAYADKAITMSLRRGRLNGALDDGCLLLERAIINNFEVICRPTFVCIVCCVYGVYIYTYNIGR